MEKQYSQDDEESDVNVDSLPAIRNAEYNQMYGHDDRQRMMAGLGINSMQAPMNHSQILPPFSNQMGYPLVINLNSLSSMLNDNRKKLLHATKASNEGDIEEAIQYLQEINKNIVFLANAADLQPNSRFVLKQERELISQEDLTYFNSKYPIQENIW
jgi:hypothetical protein